MKQKDSSQIKTTVGFNCFLNLFLDWHQIDNYGLKAKLRCGWLRVCR